MSSSIHCFIGLGNPGEKYVNTRHNAGAWFVDHLAAAHHLTFKLDKKLHGHIVEWPCDTHKVLLFKPITYMNDSGRAVAAFTKFYKIPSEAMLVAHDELDFEPGIARLKKGGGHGGHNGLRDLIDCLNTSDFYRLRIGIGHPGVRDDVSDYVLHKPSVADLAKITQSLEAAITVTPALVVGEIQSAFHSLHS